MNGTIEAWQAILIALISAGASFAGAWGGLTVKLQWLRRDVDDAHSRLDELSRVMGETNRRVDNAHTRIDETAEGGTWDGDIERRAAAERRQRNRRRPAAALERPRKLPAT